MIDNKKGTSNVHSNSERIVGKSSKQMYGIMSFPQDSDTTTKWLAPDIVHYIVDRERFQTQHLEDNGLQFMKTLNSKLQYCEKVFIPVSHNHQNYNKGFKSNQSIN